MLHGMQYLASCYLNFDVFIVMFRMSRVEFSQRLLALYGAQAPRFLTRLTKRQLILLLQFAVFMCLLMCFLSSQLS